MDSNRTAARAKAIGEALERCSFHVPEDMVQGTLEKTGTALSPRRIVRYSDRQYGNAEFPFRPLESGRTYLWKKATEFSVGRELLLLAECVFSRFALGRSYSRGTYTSVTTSGMATDASIDIAMHRALVELIERDAFMRHWMAQDGGREIDRQSTCSS